MTNYPSITDKVCSMVRAGEIVFVSARLEHNPETGAKRPWEIIKTTACGKDFRDTSWADENKARKQVGLLTVHFSAKGAV